MTRRRALGAIGSLALASGACTRTDDGARPEGPIRVVFKYTPLGAPGPLRHLIKAFEHAHPGVVVSAELLPSASGAVHQYLLTSLEGQTRDFDVFIADVIWVAEMARAGWIQDLAATFPPDEIRRDFLPGPASAALVQGGTFAVPWYADTGVFYHRKDIVPHPPATYAELIDVAMRTARRRTLHGYVWQGLQSEALICNAYETIWGFSDPKKMESPALRVVIDTPAARSALELMRALLVSGVSPPSVTSMAEEESRRVFQAGAAIFMRNWPYAFAELEGRGSPVRGLVGVAPLPSASGAPGPGALGGYQLALSAHTPSWKLEAARALIAHLTSPEANLVLATSYGRLPARRATYGDARLAAASPLIASLLPAMERARPRPVTPYYPMISDTLASEFSAAITGVRSPAEALARAQSEIDRLMQEAS